VTRSVRSGSEGKVEEVREEGPEGTRIQRWINGESQPEQFLLND